MQERILLIRTGGTIDAEPYEDPKSPPDYVTTLSAESSLLFSTVETLPNHENVDGFVWGRWEEGRFVKDSQLFTPEDIEALANIIKQHGNGYFILTHGTDAMAKNAKLLQQQLQGSNKVVAFVGAMVPLSMHQRHASDGVDALSFALKHISECPSGVHLVGRDSATERWGFFDPAHIQKDRHASLERLVFSLQPNEILQPEP